MLQRAEPADAPYTIRRRPRRITANHPRRLPRVSQNAPDSVVTSLSLRGSTSDNLQSVSLNRRRPNSIPAARLDPGRIDRGAHEITDCIEAPSGSGQAGICLAICAQLDSGRELRRSGEIAGRVESKVQREPGELPVAVLIPGSMGKASDQRAVALGQRVPVREVRRQHHKRRKRSGSGDRDEPIACERLSLVVVSVGQLKGQHAQQER